MQIKTLFVVLLSLLFASPFVQAQQEGRYSAENNSSPLVKRNYKVAEPKHKLTPQWTERYLYKHQPKLLKGSHNDHVMAFYFFGGIGVYTIMGMERVRGEDYLEYLTLLVFKDKKLIGYYPQIEYFPKEVSVNGRVEFPQGIRMQGYIDLPKEVFRKLDFEDSSSDWQAVKIK